MSDLIDLLGAMADYFKARDDLTAALDAYDGYAFDVLPSEVVERVERALERVKAEWDTAINEALRGASV